MYLLLANFRSVLAQLGSIAPFWDLPLWLRVYFYTGSQDESESDVCYFRSLGSIPVCLIMLYRVCFTSPSFMKFILLKITRGSEKRLSILRNEDVENPILSSKSFNHQFNLDICLKITGCRLWETFLPLIKLNEYLTFPLEYLVYHRFESWRPRFYHVPVGIYQFNEKS